MTLEADISNATAPTRTRRGLFVALSRSAVGEHPERRRRKTVTGTRYPEPKGNDQACSNCRLADLLASFVHDTAKFFRNSLIFGSFSASANRAHSAARFKHSIASRVMTRLPRQNGIRRTNKVL